MATDRPTFHEAWYRVATIKPRLLSSVQVYRQHFRGQIWYVLENPSSNKFSRISTDAYNFIALLDGRRTIQETWDICNEKYGDSAPTQGEVIRILGQLYGSNLLYAELAPDTEILLKRYQTRMRRQVLGYITNLLSVRIPLFDPDHFLNRWVNIFGQLFSKFGLFLWLAVVLTGVYFIFNNLSELVYQSSEVLAPDNLILLYLSLVLIKILHEFGHCFACKKFGIANGTGGEVHTMGVMFLVFMPLPYMDASSAWAFRKKRHRVIVGMAGIIVELLCASIAAIVWANTSTGTIHIIAYNVIFVASVSTLLFNCNPLLRFDAYYIMSDLVEIANFSNRSKSYLHYLVMRYAWGIKNPTNPANTRGERIWFVIYGILSTAYRIFISIRILLFLNNRLPEQFFIVVPVLAFSAIIAWVFVPLSKFVHFLVASPELARTRVRALSTTIGMIAVLVFGLGILRVPYHCRIEGIVEPEDMAIVHVESDGFLDSYLPSEEFVAPESGSIIELLNPRLAAEKKQLDAEHVVLNTRKRIAELNEVAAAQILAEQIEALQEKRSRIEDELASLSLKASQEGTWVSPNIDRAKGMYLQRGHQIGFIATLDNVIIRATANQKLAALLLEKAFDDVEIRVKGCPARLVDGKIEQIFPSGQQILPSESLGYSVGGEMPTLSQDANERRSAELFFEVRIRPAKDAETRLLTGQRVIARLTMPSEPIGVQWWHKLRQLFQRRFHI